MTTLNNVISFPTSTSGAYCKKYEVAAFVLIASLIRKKRKVINLDELYDTLSAQSSSEKNGVRWAVRDAKDQNLIASTKLKGVYQVVSM